MVNRYDIDYCDDDHNNDDDRSHCCAKIMVTIIMIVKVMRIDHDKTGSVKLIQWWRRHDMYNKLKFYYIGMESDFCNCLRIDDLLMPLNKRTKKKTANKLN